MHIKSMLQLNNEMPLGTSQWLLNSVVDKGAANTNAAGPVSPVSPYPGAMVEDALRIDCLDWEQASMRIDDWRTLAKEAIEPNIFYDPDFALSAAQHSPAANRPLFLFVSETDGNDAAGPLAAIFAIQRPRKSGTLIGRLWCPPQMAVATPLLSPKFGFAALDMIQDWLAQEYSMMMGLMLADIPNTGKFADLIRAYSQARALETSQFDLRSRAVLRNDPDTSNRITRWVGGKKEKETRRLWRRLSERGNLEVMTATTASDVKSATEYFLALEAAGWKGKRGSALLSEPSLATFARTMTRRLASHQHIEIDALMLDGVPIAMGMTLHSGDEAYFWKITYNEDFAKYSPGVLLTKSMTSRLLAKPNTRFINSCAIPNHPMIDHLWPDRIEMTDMMISLKGRSKNQYAAASATEKARRSMRGLAKTLYNKARGAQAA